MQLELELFELWLAIFETADLLYCNTIVRYLLCFVEFFFKYHYFVSRRLPLDLGCQWV